MSDCEAEIDSLRKAMEDESRRFGVAYVAWKDRAMKLGNGCLILPGESDADFDKWLEKAEFGVSDWQPIETAPKDGTRILLWFPEPMFRKCEAVFGGWDDDRYSKKPRPYWHSDLEYLGGKVCQRASQPTHWMPLPAPPEESQG